MEISDDFDFYTKYKLRGIERVLAGEKIINAIHGWVDISLMGEKEEGKSGVLVLTPTRLISYRKKLVRRHSSMDFPLRRIDSVDLNSGFMFADIKIHAGNDVIIMKQASKREGEEFVNNLKEMISKVTNPISPTSISKDPRSLYLDIAAQIKELADLKSRGILTEDEFSEHKKKLLGL